MERFLIILLLGFAKAEQRILLDSTKESMLDWFKYPKGPQSPTPGWVEESFTNVDKGINWRSYVACDVGYPNVNNWLWTPFIERGDANSIFIENKFIMRNCDLFPGTALQCKETFSLLFYEFDAATHQPPPWEPGAYKLIDRISTDEGMFSNNNEVIIFTETRSVEASSKGIYFAFRDQGACISLLATKVYYKTCPEIIHALVTYPETPTRNSELANINLIDGVCVANAIFLEDKPLSLCQSDGTWLVYNQGGCQCEAGYQMDQKTRDSCISCPKGEYKDLPGNGECASCPPNSSMAKLDGSIECDCSQGFYRSPNDSRIAGCSKPPSRPRNLIITEVAATTVTLGWDVPSNNGNRSDTVYRLFCKSCGVNVKFVPETETFQQTSICIKNLLPDTTYKFVVYSENGVSDVAKDVPQAAGLVVRTKDVGYCNKEIENLKAELIEIVDEQMKLKEKLELNDKRIQEMEMKIKLLISN